MSPCARSSPARRDRAARPLGRVLRSLAIGAATASFLALPRLAPVVADRDRASAQDDGVTVIQVSRSGIVPGASRPVTDFSEVQLAVDPTDPDHLLGCAKTFYAPADYDFYTGVFESFDGGLSWSQLQPDGLEAYSLTSDPVATFDHLGNGYFTLLTRKPGGYSGLDMLKKPAGGAWEPPVLVDDTTTTDKQWIAGDAWPTSPHAGNVYMSWTDVGNPARIVVSRTTDGNRTWSPPLEIGRGQVQGSTPAVGPDGTVYVVWGDGIFGTAGARLAIARSSDGGVTFGDPTTVSSVRPIPFFLPNGIAEGNFRSPASLPAFAAGRAPGPAPGTALLAAWADYRHGDADVFSARSLDGGRTWSAAQRVNDDPVGNGVDQIQPQVAIAPSGRMSIAWHDRRLPCPDLPFIPRDHVGRENFCLETYLARSYDGGLTWEPNLRAGAQAWDWSLSLPIVSRGTTPPTGFIGDYIGLAATDAADFPFWPATADLGDNPDRSQEVFVAIVPAPDAPAPPTPATPSPSPTTATPSPEPSPSPEPTATPDAPASPTVAPTAPPTGLPPPPTFPATAAPEPSATPSPVASATPPEASATPTAAPPSPEPTAAPATAVPPRRLFVPSAGRP